MGGRSAGDRRKTASTRGQQFIDTEWFDDIIVGTPFQTFDTIGFFAAGGQVMTGTSVSHVGSFARHPSRRHRVTPDPRAPNRQGRVSATSTPLSARSACQTT